MKKRRGMVICLLVVLTVIFVVFRILAYRENKALEPTDENILFEELGTDKLQSMELLGENNSVENEVMQMNEQQAEDDWRIHGFPYIKLTSQLEVGDYVDVRISFADGGDFILLSKKQIQGLSPLREEGTHALWLIVSEEEILRLSSAVVDAYLNEGCYIYAIQYISDSQKAAVVNYVVSDTVKQLMEEDPNIVRRAENVQEYSLWKEYEAGIQREDVYPEQEDIIYMD